MPRTVSDRRFAAPGDFTFNPPLPDRDYVSGIAALTGAGFVTVRSGGSSGAYTIVGRIYDANGRSVGTDFVIGQGPDVGGADVGTLSSGGFAVSWSENGAVRARVYDAAGVAIGAQFTANTTPNSNGVTSQVVGLEGGGFVVSWVDTTNGTLENIHGQVFTANGTKVGGEFIGGDNVPGVDYSPDLIALSGGGFAISWVQAGGDSSGYGSRAQIFDASGNKLGAAFTLNTIVEGSQVAAKLAALPNGGLVAVWLNGAEPAGSQGVWAQLFDAAGNKVGDDIFVDAGSDMADVSVIPGIGFAVVWKELSVGSPDFARLHVQIYDFAGNKTGEEFAVETGTNGIQSLPEITVLDSGAFVINWSNWEPDRNLEYSLARIFFPATLGTENADTISGTANRDFLHGLDGSDNLSGGGEDDSLDGGAGADVLDGGAGKDVLDGGADADQMSGGTGDDIYYVDATADQVIEAAGQGFDSIFTTASYALAAGSEVEWLSAASNASTQTLALVGNEFTNYLIGNAGLNILSGGGGADAMTGFAGNDAYYVDNAGDQVRENTGEGFDAVYTSVSYTLAAGVELEWFSTVSNGATTAMDLTGNAFGQYLIGNNGVNVLNGMGGADFMQGFGGNDAYHVDNGNDAPIEAAGGGVDTVYTSISFGLAAGTEIELLAITSATGTQAINLLGNEFSQQLAGNNGANALNGAGGADAMTGYGGNDIYYVDNAGDSAIEAAAGGFDSLYTTVSFTLGAGSEIEWLTADSVAGTAAISLTGNEIGQYVLGNNGANVIDGGGGSDILYGYGGADMFAFTTALGAGNVDMIVDFATGTDRIALDDAIFASLGATGALNANAFATGSAAADADDRIIYNGTTGQLFYDADGNGAGAAVLFATLQGNPALAPSDFVVI